MESVQTSIELNGEAGIRTLGTLRLIRFQVGLEVFGKLC